MDRARVRKWLRAQPGASESTPFGPDALVYKVGGKMFAVTPPDVHSVTLKCDPGWAAVLRAQHPEIVPGYHTNKRHWNTVRLDGALPSDLLLEMLEHSYTVVVDSLSRREREALRPSS
jgi:predicted DNA-binding protein (MmcQ/YjbR family)